jgi:peptidoglycan/xylan/chitin deacetylase (PgdA/CDA1 family)
MNRKQKMIIKRKLVKNPGFFFISSWLTRNRPKLFGLHRFISGDSDSRLAMSAIRFEKQLKFLTKGPWKVVALRDYLKMRLNNERIPTYLVILCIDDGYLDFYKIAFPLLKKYNFPATFFITTEFVNGNFWLWHDHLDYSLKTTHMKDFNFYLNGKTHSFNIESISDTFKTWKTFSDYCVQSPNDVKLDILSRLDKMLNVKLPQAPTNNYAAVSWEQVQKMAANNIEIGSHTCNHHILSKIPTEQMENELLLSKKTIAEKLNMPVHSFCYPNGQEKDFNDQIVHYVQKTGYLGAVTLYIRDYKSIFKLPRMGIGNDLIDFKWKLCGLETLLHFKNTGVRRLI